MSILNKANLYSGYKQKPTPAIYGLHCLQGQETGFHLILHLKSINLG